ncbi:MAG: Arm DNA-binding domain-containing protein [Croceibacterium sp.]
MTKLTKRQIEALEPTEKDYFVWDGELSGFGIRVFPTGRKQFVLQYRPELSEFGGTKKLHVHDSAGFGGNPAAHLIGPDTCHNPI